MRQVLIGSQARFGVQDKQALALQYRLCPQFVPSAADWQVPPAVHAWIWHCPGVAPQVWSEDPSFLKTQAIPVSEHPLQVGQALAQQIFRSLLGVSTQNPVLHSE